MTDYRTKKELREYKGELKANASAIEADKYAFERKLKNGLGEQIKRELEHPIKLTWWDKFKIRRARRKTIRDGNKKRGQ